MRAIALVPLLAALTPRGPYGLIGDRKDVPKRACVCDTASYEVVHPPPIAASMATVAALLAVGSSVEVRWPMHGKSA